MRRQTNQLKKDMGDLGHGSVSSMQAASAAIRTLEGGFSANTRAAEKFLSLFPAITSGLKTIFPVIGAAAFVGALVKTGEEIYNVAHQLGQIRNVANAGFASLVEGGMKTADSLRVANDRLENEIALMEHKPVNNMALAIDEARQRADELATSLNADYEGFKKLIEQSQAGFASKLFNRGVDPSLGNQMGDQFANIRTLGRQQRDFLRAGNQNGADDIAGKLRAAQEAALKFAQDQENLRNSVVNVGQPNQAKYSQIYGDQGMNFDALNTFRDTVGNQMDVADQQKRNTADAARAQGDRDKQKALEAMQKASAALLKQYELQEGQQNAFSKMTVNQEIQFWNDRLAAFRKGSEQYLQVQSKIYEEISKRPDLTKTNKENQARAGKSTVEGNDLLGNAQKALQSINIEQMERAAKSNEKYNEIMLQGLEIQAKATAAFRESSIAIALQNGMISKLGAAQQLAAAHEKEHADAISGVNRELVTQIDLIKNDPNMKGEDADRAIRNAQAEAGNRTDALNGSYQVTSQQDAANTQSNTISGAAQKSLNDMVQSFNDLAANLKMVIPETLEGLNTQIVAAMTGKKTDFGAVFSQAGDSLLKASLQKMEGSFLSAAGLGKPDGTQNNPIWTQDAGSAIGGFNSNPLFRPFMGGQQDPNGQNGQGGQKQSWWGQLGSSLLKSFFKPQGDGSGGDSAGDGSDGNGLDFDYGFQGGFARGGDILPNHSFMVGERGPELLMSRHAATVIPNHKIGGGDVHHHYNIDARGSNDPAAVHAAVMRAAPAISAHAVQATHSLSKRMPSGR